MKKFFQGKFIPKNPEKYLGSNINNITFRSGWERAVMEKFDTHPSILGWGSEILSIPYRNPLVGRWSMYVPDFVVVYVNKMNDKLCEMIEVKPEKEVPGYAGRVSQQTKLVQAVNAAKWEAAMAYCAKRGWRFRVATEKQLFAYSRT